MTPPACSPRAGCGEGDLREGVYKLPVMWYNSHMAITDDEMWERADRLAATRGVDAGDLWLEVTGLPVWWDRVGREYSRAKSKFKRYVEKETRT